jgi:hypothetical protein
MKKQNQITVKKQNQIVAQGLKVKTNIKAGLNPQPLPPGSRAR